MSPVTILARHEKRRTVGFTLVELIVVITILAILGTIGFLSINNYSSRARDSERVSDVANLSKAAELLIAAGTSLPQPDANLVTISASGTTIGYQGYAGTNVLRVLDLGGKFQDPIDGKYYTFSTNVPGTKYQTLALLENADNPSLVFDMKVVPTAYAGTYDARIPMTKGMSLGILLGTGATLNQPVQESGTAMLDIVNTTSNYLAYFSNKQSISGTGSILKKMETISLLTTAGKEGSSLNDILNGSLVGFWNMETIGADGKLKDLSGNGNDGTAYGSVVLGGTSGNAGKATSFNGTSESIRVNDAVSLRTTGDWTRSFVMRSTTPTGGDGALHDMFSQRNTSNKFLLRVDNSGNLQVSFWNGTSFSDLYTTRKVGTWQNITMVKSGAGIKLFADGVLVGTASDAQNFTNNNGEIVIGAAYTYAGQYYAGDVDDVRIYNRALSDAEVTNLYQATIKK